MARHESFDPITQNFQVLLDKSILQILSPTNCKLESNEKARMLNLLSTDPPHILAQQQFTKNEWSILITLLEFYPYYAPHEALLASVTSLSPTDCHKRLQEAEQSGSMALKRELRPVHRALSGIRAKLGNLCPYLKISPIRDSGYALVPGEDRDS